MIQEEEKEEAPVRQRDLKELLRDLGDREVRLASDDFWEQFQQPTQEEVQLRKEQAEREEEEEEEESSEDEDDVAGREVWICRTGEWTSLEDAQLTYKRIVDELPISFPVGSWQNLSHLMDSRLVGDVLITADFPPETSTSLYSTLLDCCKPYISLIS